MFSPSLAALPVPEWALHVLVLLAAWLLVSAIYQFCAWRAQALGRREAPPCFRDDRLPGPDAEHVHLAFLGDLQRGVVDVARPLAKVLDEASIDLLVSSGDFVSHGEAPYYGVLLDAFTRARVATPVRVVPGNHDLLPRRSKDDRIGGALFEKHFGPRHWARRVGPVLLVGLDVGADWLLEDQLPWLQETLDEHTDVPWILVSHRPPFFFDRPEAPPYADLESLIPVLDARPPLLAVSGHLHQFHDETKGAVRYVVNAHGGDIHGFGLRRPKFELFHVTVGRDGELTTAMKSYRRRASWRAARHQAYVRIWADRRRMPGALLAWPVGFLLGLIGRKVPVVHYPLERRYPDQEALRARRRRPLEADPTLCESAKPRKGDQP